MSVTINTNQALLERVTTENLKNGGRAMCDRILSDARIRAPKRSGDLRGNGRVEVVAQNEYRIVFGDSRVPYARRRHFENNLHPDTKYYLKNAAKEIVTKQGLGAFLR